MLHQHGRDIRVASVLLPLLMRLHPVVHLLVAERDEFEIPRREPRDRGQDAEEPGREGEAKGVHALGEELDGEVCLAGLEHAVGLAPGEVAHDVEGVVVEPFGHVDRLVWWGW